MDHQEALRRSAVEKYLLNEMPQPERDEFEEHFFGCQECAADLRATAAFLDGAKKELRRSRPIKPAQREPKRPWFDFLWRPAFAAPVFVLLLLVVAYQNVAVLPRFAGERAQLKNPEILTSLSLVGGNSRGGPASSATVADGQPLLISLDIPTAERFSSYACVLVAPSGAVVWRLPVSLAQAKDTVAIRVPSGLLERGEYRLIVQGHASPGGESADLASYRFTLNGSN
ncbi:MAG TPA: zf-HC2 domain-containing protein [Steroidobacteraceae bacterium]|nr:zf-HC2 domain-containing protein [Steroidobacteraceae bacterium]